MSTLLLRLAAPLQAWGSDSKFEVRQTGREPTKSGVIGLLASALGRGRDEPVDDLAKLTFGVRIDREGEVIRDFHTAHTNVKDVSYVTNRYYLSDAIFLVGLESEDTELLHGLEYALKNPTYPLFLGRRSCPPTLPIVLGISSDDIETSLKNYPYLDSDKRQLKPDRLRIVMDAVGNENVHSVIQDIPVSFSSKKRIFEYRKVKEIYSDLQPKTFGEHDPFAELR